MPLSSHFQAFFHIYGCLDFCFFSSVFKDLALNNKRRSNCFKGTKFITLVPALIDKHKTTLS